MSRGLRGGSPKNKRQGIYWVQRDMMRRRPTKDNFTSPVTSNPTGEAIKGVIIFGSVLIIVFALIVQALTD